MLARMKMDLQPLSGVELPGHLRARAARPASPRRGHVALLVAALAAALFAMAATDHAPPSHGPVLVG